MYGDEQQMMETDMNTFIEIELYQDTPFISGQPLYGTVHLFVRENIPDVKQVSLTLIGDEMVAINMPDKSSGGNVKQIKKNHPIINEKFCMFDYSQYENVILQG